MWCVNLEGITELVFQTGLSLPKGLEVSSLLDFVKEVIKHNMELWRDMPSLGLRTQATEEECCLE